MSEGYESQVWGVEAWVRSRPQLQPEAINTLRSMIPTSRLRYSEVNRGRKDIAALRTPLEEGRPQSEHKHKCPKPHPNPVDSSSTGQTIPRVTIKISIIIPQPLKPETPKPIYARVAYVSLSLSFPTLTAQQKSSRGRAADPVGPPARAEKTAPSAR